MFRPLVRLTASLVCAALCASAAGAAAPRSNRAQSSGQSRSQPSSDQLARRLSVQSSRCSSGKHGPPAVHAWRRQYRRRDHLFASAAEPLLRALSRDRGRSEPAGANGRGDHRALSPDRLSAVLCDGPAPGCRSRAWSGPSVVEGRIGNVRSQGAAFAQAAAIEAIATTARQRRSAEERGARARDRPDPRLSGLDGHDIALMRSDIEGGLYTLKIKVAPNRVRAFTYADNRGTGSVGHSRLYNSFAISSLASAGRRTARRPVRHAWRPFALSLRPGFGRGSARRERSAVAGHRVARVTNISAPTSGSRDCRTISRVQLSYPLKRSRALTLVGKASLTDWRSVGSQAGNRRLRDRLRVARTRR